MTLKLIDLFSGAGGMTLGFASDKFCGGFDPVLAVDNDRASVATHRENFGGHAIQANVEDWLREHAVPQADVVIGGPPCQGFSLLNKNRVGDERRALWEPFLEVVALSGARAFVMENVAELYRSPEYDRIKKKAEKLGFETVASVLNTADYGAPQVRKRTIIIGWDPSRVSGPIRLPEKTHFSPDDIEKGLGRKRWRTVRDAISDLPKEPVGTEIGTSRTLDLHFGRNPTPLSVKRYRVVPEGGNRFDLQRKAPKLTPACWIRKKSGGTDLFGRLWWDRPSVTIRTEFFKPEKGRYLHPVENRPITHREAARLMGFPDTFKFKGSKTDIARQIGNAVPPALAAAIARSILDSLKPVQSTQWDEIGTSVAAE